MARLTKAQKRVISIIAHGLVAESISRNVEGLQGFRDFIENSMDATERAIVKFFVDELKRIPKELATEIEEWKNGTSS
ncbi:hypothetical protein [Propionivibrio dicarboxylicus]|uniref:Uncharacterized protein n=1 Tax=Propionivibrio dicarboxylicus TaxID=83767 RepID=A0A1G8LBW7_9RHOO|nr:hypothetical protein [Propionivibrio dicarboxylicus]SDI53209.1 hypothetical protein SAMN05660652_03597 [Propionivibrio dicarboxylicus]